MGFFKVKTSSSSEKIDSFQSTICQYGTPVPIIWGTSIIRNPNLINWQDFTRKEHKTTHKSGKSKQTIKTYYYYAYLELALCEGVVNTKRIWVNNDEFSSLDKLNRGSTQPATPLSLNRGDNPNATSYMRNHHPNKAVGYGSLAYLYSPSPCFLGEDTASCPSVSVEVKGLLTETDSRNNLDANPSDVILDILARINLRKYADENSFAEFRNWCNEHDLLISTPPNKFDSQTTAQEIIKEILDLLDCYMFWSAGTIKIVCLSKQIQPVCSLSENNFIDDLKYSIKESTERYNRFTVNYVDRQTYETRTVFFNYQDDIAENGLKAAPAIDGSWFFEQHRAVKIAEIAAKRNREQKIKYTFSLSWNYAGLEPGDRVYLSDKTIGIRNVLATIETITENADSTLTVEAIATYNNAGSGNLTVINIDNNIITVNDEPSNTNVPIFVTPPSELTTSSSGIEKWIAISSNGANWGGCEVYLSIDDADYMYHGTCYNKANTGAVVVDEDDDITVELRERPTANGWIHIVNNTMSENMKYSTVTDMGDGKYKLHITQRKKTILMFLYKVYLKKAGDIVVVLDRNMYVVELTDEYVNSTIYCKLPSFNLFNKMLQDIEQIQSYSSNVTVYDVVDVNNLTATVGIDNVALTWTKPQKFSSATVYYKLADSSDWFEVGSTSDTRFVINNLQADTDYKVGVCVRDINGHEDAIENAAQLDIHTEPLPDDNI